MTLVDFRVRLSQPRDTGRGRRASGHEIGDSDMARSTRSIRRVPGTSQAWGQGHPAAGIGSSVPHGGLGPRFTHWQAGAGTPATGSLSLSGPARARAAPGALPPGPRGRWDRDRGPRGPRHHDAAPPALRFKWGGPGRGQWQTPASINSRHGPGASADAVGRGASWAELEGPSSWTPSQTAPESDLSLSPRPSAWTGHCTEFPAPWMSPLRVGVRPWLPGTEDRLIWLARADCSQVRMLVSRWHISCSSPVPCALDRIAATA
jgi:hypothetical protein